MARCEDFPCCGHEAGCCPDYDEGGGQMNMRCTCGAVVPLSSRSSMCSTCLSQDDGEFYPDDDGQFDGCDEDDTEDFNDEDEGDYPDDTPLGDDYGGE